MQIYVGNLAPGLSDEDVRALFTPFGTVASAVVGKDKDGAPEGYALVVMPVKSEARAAADELRGKEIDGKPLRVRILKPGDEFHDRVHLLKAQASGGSTGFVKSQRFRGDLNTRGSGSIRRSGKRGS
jgi:RNA recognition motif-containing protein